MQFLAGRHSAQRSNDLGRDLFVLAILDRLRRPARMGRERWHCDSRVGLQERGAMT